MGVSSEPSGAGADGRPAEAGAAGGPSDVEDLLEHLGQLMDEIDGLDEAVRARVFDLLDGVDLLHRTALERLGAALDDGDLERLRAADPAVAWLFDAYAVGVDQQAAAERALDEIRPYIHSHGGEVEVLDIDDGVVHVRLSGACSGCSASAITLREGVEDALREHMPGFVDLTVEEDHAEPHPPPGPTLLQIQDRPPG